MSLNYSISPLAYLKIVLHSAKYPSSTIVGILIGSLEGGSINVVIQDVIPLLHHWTSLSCMMEAGLQLAEIHCKAQNMSFLGLYVANARLEATNLPAALTVVANKMKQVCSETIVLILDNLKLAQGESALITLTSTSPSGWTPSASITLIDTQIPQKALHQARAGHYQKLADFDEHLEDVTRDWLENKDIVL